MQRIVTLFVMTLSLTLGLAQTSSADQWVVLDAADAQRAVALLEPGTIVLDHCSACTDSVEVIRVTEVRNEPWDDDDDRRYLVVEGELLLRSEESFSPLGYGPEIATFSPPRGRVAPRRVARRVDLAYLYVEAEEAGAFDCVSVKLGLPTGDIFSRVDLPRHAWVLLEEMRRPAPVLGQADSPVPSATGWRDAVGSNPAALEADHGLRVRYKELAGRLDVPGQNRLEVAQRLWEAYRQAEVDLGAGLAPALAISTYTQLTIQRRKLLEAIIEERVGQRPAASERAATSALAVVPCASR